MDIIADTFGGKFACECGRTHRITPEQIVFASDAFERAPEVCSHYASGKRVAMIMDARTREAAGAKLADTLARAGWDVDELLVADPVEGAWPVCDEQTKTSLAGMIGSADLILPVGSGVICDLGKWLAFEADLPLVTFATAASMNGYASANVAPTIDGVKSLVRAHPPQAILACPGVLRDAPAALTSAGLGDVLAKSVSSADWRLNHLLFGDYYCQHAVGLIGQIEPLYMDHPADLPAGRGRALEALFAALLLTGAAMTMAETSAPASGGEHLISHSLDMMASLDGCPHDLHGRQVGVSTIITSELYRRMLAIESPRWTAPPTGIDEAFWGHLAPAIAAQYQQKLARLDQARQQLANPGVWQLCRQELATTLRPPEQIRDCLAGAQAAIGAEDIIPQPGRWQTPPDRLLQALLHAHEIRPRFTILDLAYLAGLMPSCAADILSILS